MIVALALLASGCGVHVALTKRAGLPEPIRSSVSGQPCEDVQVLDGRAPHDWEVVAVIDLAAFSVRALPRDDDAFLALVRPAVCEAGGDAVIAGVNGDGRYVLGTVIAWVESEASHASEDAGSPPAEAPTADSIAGRSARAICPEDAAC